MKVTIDTTRGVVTELDGNGIFVNGSTTFVQPFAQTGQNVTTTSSTITLSHTMVTTSGNCTLTLPNASSVDQQEFKVKKNNISAYSLTISPINDQTIDGQTSIIITAQYTAVTLYAFEGSWHIF